MKIIKYLSGIDTKEWQIWEDEREKEKVIGGKDERKGEGDRGQG